MRHIVKLLLSEYSNSMVRGYCVTNNHMLTNPLKDHSAGRVKTINLKAYK